MFIGRKEEINKIVDRLENNKRELIAITGKRGVGKTELMNIIEKIYLKKDDVQTFYFYGQKNTSMKKQIQNLCLSIDEKINQTKILNIDIKKIDNWNLFFKYFDQIINSRKNNEKIIVFIDEFPWLNTKGSNFINDFGTFWNKNNYENFKIILTGSAVSWITKNVFRSKGGLYHKTTLKIKLKSFSLQETIEYLLKENSNFTNSELVEYYLMTGGVVRYLQNIHGNRTIEENYDEIYKNKYFDDFFDNTFNSMKTNVHKKIIHMFSNKIKIKIEDIEKEMSDISLQLIYGTIKELVETDLLIEIKDRGSKKNKSYILSDLYCFNHLRKRSDINNGFAFEIMVMNNIEWFLKEAGFNHIYFDMNRWQNDKAQIDLLIDFMDKTNYVLIECKYYNKTFDFNDEYKANFINKIDEYKKDLNKKKIFIYPLFISMFGAKNRTSFNYKNLCLNDLIDNYCLHLRKM